MDFLRIRVKLILQIIICQRLVLQLKFVKCVILQFRLQVKICHKIVLLRTPILYGLSQTMDLLWAHQLCKKPFILLDQLLALWMLQTNFTTIIPGVFIVKTFSCPCLTMLFQLLAGVTLLKVNHIGLLGTHGEATGENGDFSESKWEAT